MKSRIFLKLFARGPGGHRGVHALARPADRPGLGEHAAQRDRDFAAAEDADVCCSRVQMLLPTRCSRSPHRPRRLRARASPSSTPAARFWPTPKPIPTSMENHATRPEFVAALHGQVGSSTRVSKTMGVELLYVAVPIPGGAVRMAYPLTSIREANAANSRRSAGRLCASRDCWRLLLAFRRDAIDWPQAGAHHRLRRASRRRRSVGANSGRVERRNCARGLGARQDSAQAGRRISRVWRTAGRRWRRC